MKKKVRDLRFILILIPLALIITIMDKTIINGFLSTNKILDHYIFLTVLVSVVIILLVIIFRYDKKINK
mgnify:FL=1|jgi:hypothetical protein